MFEGHEKLLKFTFFYHKLDQLGLLASMFILYMAVGLLIRKFKFCPNGKGNISENLEEPSESLVLISS